MSDSLGLVDFPIGLVDSKHHLLDRQVKIFWELKLQNYYGPKAVFQADLTKGNLLKKVFHYMYISCPTLCVQFFLCSLVQAIQVKIVSK